MPALFLELRHAARGLSHNPAFSVIVVATIALAIGATAAIATSVYAVVLRPLPFPEPDRLVRITSELRGFDAQDTGVAWPELADYEQRRDLFSSTAAIGFANANVTTGGEPERIELLLVGWQYFDVLGVPPARGRAFGPQDAGQAGAAVVVVSDRFWRRRLGAREDVIGTVLRLDGDPYTVVGIAPPDFRHPGRTLQADVEAWSPQPDAGTMGSRGRRVLPGVVARLQPGVTLEQARANLAMYGEDVRSRFAADYPAATGWMPAIVPLAQDVVGGVSGTMFVLLAGASLVLIIACVNVSNLMLARRAERRTESAIRESLGATTWRLRWHGAAEGVVLAVVGGAVSVLVSAWSLRALLALSPQRLPRVEDIAIGGVTFVAIAVLSLVVGVVLGIAGMPARTASVHDTLRTGSTRASTRDGRTRAVLVGAQVALATLLLVVAGLFVRTVGAMLDVPLGFRTDSLLTARVWLPLPADRAAGPYASAAGRAAFQREVLDHVERIPGVERAAVSNQIPIGGFNAPLFFEIEGRDLDREGQRPVMHFYQVSASYFDTLEIPLLGGRRFTPRDREGAEEVAIVSASAARTFWGNANPLGQRLRFRPQDPWLRIVGVVGDVRTRRLTDPPPPIVYRPVEQDPTFALGLLVRMQPNATGVGEAVSRAVLAVDPAVPVYAVRTMEELQGAGVAQRRFLMRILLAFGAVALVLALLGLYGVMAYAVMQRTREIGIRMAVGATGTDVIRLILDQGIRVTAFGVSAGALLALWASAQVQALLFGVRPVDPLTWLVVVLLVLIVAIAAAAVPARRAAVVDPLTALRLP